MYLIKNLKKKDKILTPRLILRPMVESDSKKVVSWIKILSQESYSVFLNKKKNLTIKRHLSWFKNRKKNRIDYVFFEKLSKKPVGILHFREINNFLGTAEAGKFIGDFSFRKKGFAKEAFGYWLRFGFQKLGFKNIHIFTDANNINNINLNLKLGFKIVDQKIKSKKDKNFLKMQISKPDIIQINKALNIN